MMVKLMGKLFLILIPLVILTQVYLLKPHLQMGRNDLDDGYTMDFRLQRKLHPNPVDFVLATYQKWGAVYFHQYYYVGILDMIFGDNLQAWHTATHIFKILATISIFALFLVLTESGLVAFVGAVLYGFSSSAIGAFDSVVQSSDYPAILMLSIFLSTYFYLVKKAQAKRSLVLASLLFFWAALIFSTERTYPVVMLIFLVELGIILMKRSGVAVKLALRRTGPLVLPILFLVALQPRIILVMLLPSWKDLGQRLAFGSQEILLYPFVSFASIFLPSRFWEYKDLSLPIGLMVVTLILSLFLVKKPLRLVLITVGIWVLGVLMVNGLSAKAPYFVNFAKVAMASFFILGLSIGFLVEWLKTRDQKLVGLFLGPLGALVFIYSIWLGTGDRATIFIDTHRYLTTAAIFSCLFLASLIVAIQQRLRKRLKIFSYGFFLLLIILMAVNLFDSQDYFKKKLVAGINIKNQQEMRAQLLPYYQHIDPKNPRLLYMETKGDPTNGDIYGNTISAGWNAWPLWWPHLKDYTFGDMPVIGRENMELSKVEESGQIFVSYNQILFKPENFYALRWKDLKFMDITEAKKKELGL